MGEAGALSRSRVRRCLHNLGFRRRKFQLRSGPSPARYGRCWSKFPRGARRRKIPLTSSSSLVGENSIVESGCQTGGSCGCSKLLRPPRLACKVTPGNLTGTSSRRSSSCPHSVIGMATLIRPKMAARMGAADGLRRCDDWPGRATNPLIFPQMQHMLLPSVRPALNTIVTSYSPATIGKLSWLANPARRCGKMKQFACWFSHCVGNGG